MTDTEYQNLLAPAMDMSERESAQHYYHLAENWYHLQNNKAFKAFSKHITRILNLLSSSDKNARLDAVRALAFIAAYRRLHLQLFESNCLKSIVYILGSSFEAANCEAALVVLNHLCTQSPKNNKHKYELVSDFCQDKQSLIIIFRYAHVEDRCLSIIANVFSVLAALTKNRPNIQEHCIRAGIMERAFNLRSTHRDRIVRTNVDLFLNAMQLSDYSGDKFNEMHQLICENMGYSSRALCLGLWRLVITKRFQHALNTNTLYTVVHKISIEDPTLEEDWKVIATPVDPNDQNKQQNIINNNNNNINNAININNNFNNYNNNNQNNLPNKQHPPNRKPKPKHNKPKPIANVVNNNNNNAYNNNNIPNIHNNNNVQLPKQQNIANGSNYNQYQKQNIPKYNNNKTNPIPNSHNHHQSPPSLDNPNTYPSHIQSKAPSNVNNGHINGSYSNSIMDNISSYQSQAHSQQPHSQQPQPQPQPQPQLQNNNNNQQSTYPSGSQSVSPQSNDIKYDDDDKKIDHNIGFHRIKSVPSSTSVFQNKKHGNNGYGINNYQHSKSLPYDQYKVFNSNNDNNLPSISLSYNKSWLEKEIHIAILHTNPIETDDGGNLALNAEKRKLQDVFFRTTRGLKIFFGVLTKDSLIRCIQRGAQIVHISGHGPYEKKLKVEDRYGRLKDLNANKIKEAIEAGKGNNNNNKGSQLKLVFVSTCYSEHVAQSFCDAGVPHVVAVHSMVQILDQMATKFASAFYEALIAHKKSVSQAFTNSVAELLLENEVDCCCRHEGHTIECICALCKIPRCCQQHHYGINSKCPQGKMQSIQQQSNNQQQNDPNNNLITCCAPDVPHNHADKFLLLPVNTNHDEKILTNLPDTQCERIDSRADTNVGTQTSKIVGRQRDIRILVDFLHPDDENAVDVVLIYGRPQIGLTTVALQVARFFTRPWYQAIFLGGVWRINLQNCDDPNSLYTYIAQAMSIKTVLGKYLYFGQNQLTKKYSWIEYNDDIQKELHSALTGDDAFCDPIEYFGDIDQVEHYIILDQHKNHREELKQSLPTVVYNEFIQRIRSLPMEFFIDINDNTKVNVRKIKFQAPNDDQILQDIKKYGTSYNNQNNNGSFQFIKFLIIDHISFPRHKIKQFLQKIKRLTQMVKVKLLLICHDKIEVEISKMQKKFVAQCSLKQRTWRIKAIGKKDAAKLLLEQSRQLYEFDFTDLNTPSTADDTAQFPIFEWLSKSPALIQSCSTVLDRKVPFCVIIKCMNQQPSEWKLSLNAWTIPLKLSPDELKDALNALTGLLTEINVVKSIWNDD